MSRFEDITIWFSKLPGKYMKVIETVYVGNGMYGYNIKNNEGNIIKSEPGIYDYCHVRYKAVEAALLINLDIWIWNMEQETKTLVLFVIFKKKSKAYEG